MPQFGLDSSRLKGISRSQSTLMYIRSVSPVTPADVIKSRLMVKWESMAT